MRRTRPFFGPEKQSYEKCLIDYPESPTKGVGYIGVAKRPLMKVKKGYGYIGVIMQDAKKEFIQCHACGRWMKKIASKHLFSCSGMSVVEYKRKYGLNIGIGLVSDQTSLKLTANCLKGLKGKSRASMLQRFGNKKNTVYNVGPRKQSTEFFNKYATCPLQLKARLYEFIRVNREMPSQANRGRSIYKALTRRYGRFGDGLRVHGLPYLERNGTNMEYTFADGTKYKYNINQMYDREALYKILMKKCPFLQKTSWEE